jgi:hypothetical protein
VEADHSGEAAWVIVRAGMVREIGWQSADLLAGETRLWLDSQGKELRILTDEEGVAWIWAEGVEPESTLEGYDDAVRRLGSRFHRG